jgi:aspartyl-tRNA(Asn)/glutamyl-tRNA(Gln) amidotransferase subunit C
MAQRLTLEQIAHVARLARLAMSEEEMRQMEKHLNNLMELDTTGVEPTAHSFPVYNVFREDVVQPSLPHEDVLANAPEQRDGCFIVPIIVEE